MRDKDGRPIEVGAILKGPRGGMLFVAHIADGAFLYTHKLGGWSTIWRLLANPRKYVRMCEKTVRWKACVLPYGHTEACRTQ